MCGFLKAAATVITNQGKVPTSAAFGNVFLLPPMTFRNLLMTLLVAYRKKPAGISKHFNRSSFRNNF
jgi:hypothetical protein